MEPIKVFLRYVREDYSIVKSIYDKLKQNGISPWMDKENLLPGENWERSIIRSVQNSDFILVFLSDNSVSKRGFFQREVKIALKLWDEKLEDDIFIIPILINDCEVPESIIKIQWIEIKDENYINKIIESIKVGSQKLGKAISFNPDVIKINKKKIQESDTKELSYYIDVEYPQIESFDNILFDEVNSIIRGKIISLVQEARQEGMKFLDDKELRKDLSEYSATNDLFINYHIEYVSKKLISLQFTITTYSAGAAHPLHGIFTLNFELNPTIQLELDSIFNSESQYLEAISTYCINNLKKQLTQEEDFLNTDKPDESLESALEWINEGASPDKDRLDNFCFNQNGLIILFDDYAVGPYSWGHRRVEIPFSQIEYMIDNKSVKKELL